MAHGGRSTQGGRGHTSRSHSAQRHHSTPPTTAPSTRVSHSAQGHHLTPPTTALSTRGSHSSQGNHPATVPLPPPTMAPLSPPITATTLPPTMPSILPSTTVPIPPTILTSPQTPGLATHSNVGQLSKSDTRRLITLLYIGCHPVKFEPQAVTRSITKSLFYHLPGPVAQWRDYPTDVLDSLFQSFLRTYRFATAKQEEDAKIVWKKVAGRRFVDYLNKKKELAKKAVGGVVDPLQWKDHNPLTIRKDYWNAMCDQWAAQGYRARSTVATQNRAKIPEASLHTNGSISFGSHKKTMGEKRGGSVSYTELFHRPHKRRESGEFVSQKAKEVVESNEQQLVDGHGDDSSQHPQLDASTWLATVSQPKEDRVFGFSTKMDVDRVISSSMESRCSATSYNCTQSPPSPPPPAQLPPPLQPLTELPDHYCSALIRQLDSWFDRKVVPALHAMGVVFPHPHPPPCPPPSTAGSDQVVGDQVGGDADGDDNKAHNNAHLSDS